MVVLRIPENSPAQVNQCEFEVLACPVVFSNPARVWLDPLAESCRSRAAIPFPIGL